MSWTGEAAPLRGRDQGDAPLPSEEPRGTVLPTELRAGGGGDVTNFSSSTSPGSFDLMHGNTSSIPTLVQASSVSFLRLPARDNYVSGCVLKQARCFQAL